MKNKLLYNEDVYTEVTFKLVGFSYYVTQLEFDSFGDSTIFRLKHDKCNKYNPNAIAAYSNDKLVAYISEKDLHRVIISIDNIIGEVFCKCIGKTRRHMNVVLCSDIGEPKRFLLKQEHDFIERDIMYEKRLLEYNYSVFPDYDEISGYDSVIRTTFDVKIISWNEQLQRDNEYRQISGVINPNTIFSLIFNNGCPVVYKAYEKDYWDEDYCKYYFILKDEARTLIRFEEFKSHIVYDGICHKKIAFVKSVIPRSDVSILEIYQFIKQMGENQKYIARTGNYHENYFIDHGEHGPERHLRRNYPYVETYR